MTEATQHQTSEPAAPQPPETASRSQPHPAQDALLRSRTATSAPGSNCVFAYRVRGSLRAAELATAYTHALGTFDALRLRLCQNDTQPYWQAGSADGVDVRVSHLQPSDDPAHITAQIATIAMRRFDLEAGPVGVVEILDCRTELVVVVAIDHAIADGRSLQLLHHRVRDALTPASAPRSRLPGSYTQLLEEADLRRNDDIAYWAETFAEFDPERPDTPAHHDVDGPDERVLDLPPERAASLAAAARRAKATPAGALLAALTHAVARYRGTSDLAVLVATDCRSVEHLDTFGQATRLLPLRARHRWEESVAAHARTMTRAVLRGREHCDVDLEELDRCGAPIALAAPDAVAFIYQHDPVQPPRLPAARTRAIPVPDLHHAGGLTCVVHQLADGATRLSLRATSVAVDHRQLEAITDTIDAFLLALTARPGLALDADDLLPREDLRAVTALAAPHRPYPFIPIDEQILTRLRTTSGIVLEDGRHHSARDLLDAVERLGAELDDAGVRYGDAVIVDAAAPTFHRIAAFVATLHHGAIYIPLGAPTSQHPALDQLSSTQRSIWQLCGKHLRPIAAAGNPVNLPAIAPTPHDPAYVIFTSGTTGTPKGVVVSRFNVANLVAGEADRFGLNTSSRVLLIAPATTDPWICHVGAALSHGATLVVADPRDGVEDTLAERGVTHAFLPAALAATVNPARTYPDLTMIATAGDRCDTEAIQHLHRPGRQVFNIYGPTETTVTATICELDPRASAAPIGRPIRGMGAKVTIDRRAAAPPEVVGELMLTGAGVALGYLGGPGEDSGRFSQDPATGHRWYATGDRAWLGTDGQLYFAGRNDRQIKVRGFRVDLGHFEHAARSTGLCTDAAAVATGPDRDRRIVVYVEGCPSRERLLNAIAIGQASHLRPHTIEVVHELPRTPSGAIDTQALALHPKRSPNTGDDPTATELPEPFTRAWTSVLGAPPTPDSDFFDSGADSLDVLRFVRAARDLDLAIAPSAVYAAPRAADMAQQLTSQPGPSGDHPHDHAESVAFGPAQAWLETLNLPQPRRWNQQYVITVTGRHSADRITEALQKLLDRTPILSAAVHDRNFRFGRPTELAASVLVHARDSDARIRDSLDQIHDSLDPEWGKMLRAMLLLDDGFTAVVLAAHHLVVDDWSWTLIEQRLRQALGDGPNSHDPDFGYHRHAAALSQRTSRPTDARPWADIYANGLCADLHDRPDRLLRQIVDLPRTPHRPGAAHLLAAFARGLAHIEPHDISVVDLERNGRTTVPAVDLTDAVGWFALHHPITLAHRHDLHRHRQDLTETLADITDSGLGYGLARWVHREFEGSQVGRFAVNITDNASVPADTHDRIAERLRRCAVPLSGTNILPYEATLVLRHGSQLELHYDPARMPPRQARAVITETARAYIDAPSFNDHPPQHRTP